MIVPSRSDRFQVLLLQLASDGRREALLGDSFERVRAALPPYLVGNKAPSVYLELPLAGDPFLDVTLLYSEIEPGTSVDAPEAAGTEELFDWFSVVSAEQENINIGFELDTNKPILPQAAIHFQHRSNLDLVRPFFEAIGEAERTDVYLGLVDRMPSGWKPDFLGLFRGRPDSPLRVCGYLESEEQRSCAEDAHHLVEVFETMGFEAYDGQMLDDARKFMSDVDVSFDYQVDVYPDGHLGEVFSLDINLGIHQTDAVRKSFSEGAASRVMGEFERLGAADSRWQLIPDSVFARSVPVMLEDGTRDRLSFTLIPQWVKVRWKSGVPQPSKIYYSAQSCCMDSETS